MTGLRLLCAWTLATFLVPSPALASTADWFIIALGAPDYAPIIEKGQSADDFMAFVPRRVLVAPSDIPVIAGKYSIPAGTLFVPVDGDGSGKVCEMARHLGSAFTCLIDRDHDGAYESYFGQQVFSEFYFGSHFKEEHFTPLVEPRALRELDPLTQIAPIKAKLTFAGGSPKGKMRFRVCLGEPSGTSAWAKGLYKNMCIAKEYSADGALPGQEIDVFGLHVKIEPAGEKSVKVSVDPAQRRTMATFAGRAF
ncbi:MAG: hypothetical protein ACKOOL_08915 [Novosphingobium sp.]